MVTLKCASCGHSAQVEATSGKPMNCGKCGAALKAPSRQLSATEKALLEAEQAMDAKERKRKGKPEGRSAMKSSGSSVYELGTHKRTPESSAAAAVQTSSTPLAKRKITPRQLGIATGALAGVAVLYLIYSSIAPTGWESEQRETILAAKSDGDRLASQGKAKEAFDAYGKIVLMATNQTLHSGEIKEALAAARDARTRLFPQVKELDEKARTARYSK
jgi:hypothetical protein